MSNDLKAALISIIRGMRQKSAGNHAGDSADEDRKMI
jgi:hypothetical protein